MHGKSIGLYKRIKLFCHSERSEESEPVERCFLRQHDKNCEATKSLALKAHSFN